MPPLVYGTGSGPFKTNSIQIPTLIKAALKEKRPVVVGTGSGEWDYVHVADLALLYEIIVDKVVRGEELPYGKKGIYFAGTGRSTWLEMAKAIGKAGVSLGLLDSAEPRELTLDEAAPLWPHRNLIELGLATK